MAKGIIDSSILQNIANAIRRKTGKTDAIAPANMATEIEGIQAGSGKDAFYQSVLERTFVEVTAEDLADVATVGNRGLAYCTTVKRITLPSHFTDLGVGFAYDDTNLEELNFNEGLTKIPQHGVRGCKKLTHLTFPSTINEVMPNAVENTGVTSIKCLGVEPPFARYPLFYNNSAKNTNLTKIEVPAQSVDAYKAATNWAEYADIIIPIEE